MSDFAVKRLDFRLIKLKNECSSFAQQNGLLIQYFTGIGEIDFF